MKCEDCIHDGVCLSQISYFMGCDEYTGEEVTDIEKKCSDFKNKADYAEVKHGEWKNPSIKRFEGRYFVCSECDVMLPIITELLTFDFCPRCGAKMDGRGDIK